MAVCLTESVALYKIEAETGKINRILKVQADFSSQDPSLNQCLLYKGVIVSGGDDGKVRLFTLKDNIHDSISTTVELSCATQPVTGVDINYDLSKVVATSKDGFAYVFDVKTKTLID
jgi:WD40 repeat protein